MTYLQHLAARTLNQLPIVQPRLPSRFEAARHAPGTDMSTSIENATFTSSAPSITAGTATFAPANTVSESPHVMRNETPVVHTSETPPRATWEAVSINPTLVQPTEIQRAEETDRGLLTAPITAVAPGVITREIDHSTETIINNTTFNERTTTIDQRTTVERERLTSPAAVTPVDTPRSPRLTPHIEPYVPPAPERAASPESAPAIHVSIGRIEVRAMQTPASAPAVPPAPKHKIISLDDYLHGVRT